MCATVSWGAHESYMHPIFVLKNGCDTHKDQPHIDLFLSLSNYLVPLSVNVTRNTFDSKNSHTISTKLIVHTGH
jgi:hypothetical protein